MCFGAQASSNNLSKLFGFGKCAFESVEGSITPKSRNMCFTFSASLEDIRISKWCTSVFGEAVMWRRKRHPGALNKYDSEWSNGVDLGVAGLSVEALIGTCNGVVRTNDSIRHCFWPYPRYSLNILLRHLPLRKHLLLVRRSDLLLTCRTCRP